MNIKNERIIKYNKENIIKSADKLFIENGLDKTTMDLIAKEALTTKPTLYGYFKNKDEIYFSIVYRYMNDLFERIRSIIQSESSCKEMYLAICNEIVLLRENHEVYFTGMISDIAMNIEEDSIYKEIYLLGEEINTELLILLNKASDEKLITIDKATKFYLLYLWSSISGIVRMAFQKRDYLKHLGIDFKEFLEKSFLQLIGVN